MYGIGTIAMMRAHRNPCTCASHVSLAERLRMSCMHVSYAEALLLQGGYFLVLQLGTTSWYYSWHYVRLQPDPSFRAAPSRLSSVVSSVKSVQQEWISQLLARPTQWVRGRPRRALCAPSGKSSAEWGYWHSRHDLMLLPSRQLSSHYSWRKCGTQVRWVRMAQHVHMHWTHSMRPFPSGSCCCCICPGCCGRGGTTLPGWLAGRPAGLTPGYNLH